MKNAALAIAILYIFLQIIIAQSTYYGCSGQSPPFDPASWPTCCSTIKIQLNLRFNLENSIRFLTFIFGCNNIDWCWMQSYVLVLKPAEKNCNPGSTNWTFNIDRRNKSLNPMAQWLLWFFSRFQNFPVKVKWSYGVHKFKPSLQDFFHIERKENNKTRANVKLFLLNLGTQ